MGARRTDRDLASRVAALLIEQMRSRFRPSSPADPALDAAAALIEQGLSRDDFPAELIREAHRAGLRVDIAALAMALVAPPLD